jgi:hypothetical protein
LSNFNPRLVNQFDHYEFTVNQCSDIAKRLLTVLTGEKRLETILFTKEMKSLYVEKEIFGRHRINPHLPTSDKVKC